MPSIRGMKVSFQRISGVALIALASFAPAQVLAQQPHSHGDAEPKAPITQIVTRTVEVVMDDTMRFTPSAIEAVSGETLRIVARNAGRVEHELVIGSENTIREHARAMKQGGAHSHTRSGAAISVAPGKTGELVVTLREPAVLQMACLVPGHYEAGKRGTLTVARQATGDAHKH